MPNPVKNRKAILNKMQTSNQNRTKYSQKQLNFSKSNIQHRSFEEHQKDKFCEKQFTHQQTRNIFYSLMLGLNLQHR